MGEFVDISLAIAFVVISLSFWAVYYITPSEFITKKFITWFQIKHFDTNITKHSMFYLFSVSAFVLFCLTLVHRYGITNGDWNHWLFASRIDLIERSPFYIFPYRQIWIFRQLFYFIFIIELAVLFIVPFIKQTSINKISYQLVSCLFALIWTFICFGDGSRHNALFVPGFIVLLTGLFLLNKIRYSKRYYFILTVYLVINLFSLLLMPAVRIEGYPAIKRYFTNDSDKLIKHIEQKTFLTSVDEKQIHRAKEIFDKYTIKTEPSTEYEIKTKSLTGQNIDREFFRKFTPRSYPDMCALYFMYYGTYQPHYGIAHWMYRTLEWRTPEIILKAMGKEKLPHIFTQTLIDIQNKPKDFKNTFPTGCWTEGYIYAGHIGAILFAVLAGIYYGFAAKVIISLSRSNLWNRLDTLLVILYFYYIYIFCAQHSLQYAFVNFVHIIRLFLIILSVNLYCRYFIPKLQTIKQAHED
jgi:hypothetical protein